MGLVMSTLVFQVRLCAHEHAHPAPDSHPGRTAGQSMQRS